MFMPGRLAHFVARQLLGLLTLGLTLALVRSAALAHEGHDAGPVVASASTVPGMIVRSASSDRFELVCKYLQPAAGQSVPVRFYVSEVETNAPVQGATLSLDGSADAAQVSGIATAVSPGVYQATLMFPAKGSYVMKVTIKGVGRRANLALADLDVGYQTSAPAGPSRLNNAPLLIASAAFVVIMLVFLVIFIARRRATRGHASALILALWISGLASAALPSTSRAHEGHDQGPAAAGPGGFRFVAKESQFLLGIRTSPAPSRVLHERVSALGHVVVESGASASLAAPQSGRLERADRLPAVGDHVRLGRSWPTSPSSIAWQSAHRSTAQLPR